MGDVFDVRAFRSPPIVVDWAGVSYYVDGDPVVDDLLRARRLLDASSAGVDVGAQMRDLALSLLVADTPGWKQRRVAAQPALAETILAAATGDSFARARRTAQGARSAAHSLGVGGTSAAHPQGRTNGFKHRHRGRLQSAGHSPVADPDVAETYEELDERARREMRGPPRLMFSIGFESCMVRLRVDADDDEERERLRDYLEPLRRQVVAAIDDLFESFCRPDA